MMEILAYFRSLFPTTRSTKKRSASEDFELPSCAKHRRLNVTGPEDDWLSTSALSMNRSRRSSFMDPIDISLKPSWPKPISTIVIEDDDDIKKIVKRPQVTSTPNTSKNKENSFLTFAKYGTSIRKPSLKTKIEHIKPKSSYFNPRDYKSPSFGIKKAKALTGNEFAFRLDEKLKYEKLINNSSSFPSDYNSFSEYGTPIGKIPPASRTQKILNLATKSIKPLEILDLTNGDVPPSNGAIPKRLSTKETIIKVLDDLEDVVIVKDNDFDVEILPSPPSPKPDIKVDRINSLKMSSHPTEPQHDNWIDNKIKSHAERIAHRAKEIEQTNTNLRQIKEINEEVRSKQLAEQVKKCLHIKEIVLAESDGDKLPELSEKQESMISAALDRSKSPGAVLSSKFSLNISRRDMLTLAGLNWLNDEVINFYMNLIMERGKLDKYPNAYAFNTFFYPKLLKDGHSSIRRWTRKVDIFAHDLICVPIHMSMHWCMAIIDFQNKTVGYYDSMGKPNHQCTEALLRYLQEEHLDKKKSHYDVSDWKLKCYKDIPQQMNGSDCGMFSCTYAEFTARRAPFTFSQEDMPYLRRKMVLEILNGSLLVN